MTKMTREKQQKILDVLGDLLSRQYGCEVTLTLKEESEKKDDVRALQLENA